jgi:hypothetical protein
VYYVTREKLVGMGLQGAIVWRHAALEWMAVKHARVHRYVHHAKLTTISLMEYV